MSKKTFTIIKLIVVILLSTMISISITMDNYILPIVGIIAAASFLYVMTKKVKDVMADERDYKIAGKSARISITIYSMVMVIIGITTLGLSKAHPEFEFASHVMLYSTCMLMILNGVLFKIYSKYSD